MINTKVWWTQTGVILNGQVLILSYRNVEFMNVFPLPHNFCHNICSWHMNWGKGDCILLMFIHYDLKFFFKRNEVEIEPYEMFAVMVNKSKTGIAL